ncbi:unnamed protein product [Schistosoma mattheei]|uniref:Uncharacterized protein n=1 Tax=Schistosoma mattheei TaxID=31246 RepID=A0A183PVK6_9TREM|nr:unnamed protein product [Schistosoma mattheei]
MSAQLNPSDIEAARIDLLINVTSQTVEEIRMYIKQTKCGEVAEPDNIPVEALTTDKEVTANMMHLPFRKVSEEK